MKILTDTEIHQVETVFNQTFKILTPIKETNQKSLLIKAIDKMLGRIKTPDLNEKCQI